MVEIKDINALKVLDSRGNWTVETRLGLTNGLSAAATVPTGASVGPYEKRSVVADTAVSGINGIVSGRLLGNKFSSLFEFDKLLVNLDGTNDRSNLGANTLLSLSMAFCRCLAMAENMPLYRYLRSIFNKSLGDFFLPRALFNLVNGGAHAHDSLDFQEFLFLPEVGSLSFEEVLARAANVFHVLGQILENNGFSDALGDEGGYAPDNISHEGVLKFMTEAAAKAQLAPIRDYSLGLDAAAASLVMGDLYRFSRRGVKMTRAELRDYYLNLCQKFPIIYLEDPFAYDNLEDYHSLKKLLLNKVEIVGDDSVATNRERLKLNIAAAAISAVIIKPNQIGTISETFETAELARSNCLKLVVSHRSGETDDAFIADLAVGLASEYIKAGAPGRGERVAKYNRLLEIESELKDG